MAEIRKRSAFLRRAIRRHQARQLDKQWSQLPTFSVGGQRSVVKQTAIRASNILVVVSSAPGVTAAHLAKAVDEARSAE